jgi:hypothetical protein
MLPAVLTDSDDGDDDGAPPPPPPPPPLSHAARAAGKRGTCERQPRTHICAHAHVAGWQFLAAAAAQTWGSRAILLYRRHATLIIRTVLIAHIGTHTHTHTAKPKLRAQRSQS